MPNGGNIRGKTNTEVDEAGLNWIDMDWHGIKHYYIFPIKKPIRHCALGYNEIGRLYM